MVGDSGKLESPTSWTFESPTAKAMAHPPVKLSATVLNRGRPQIALLRITHLDADIYMYISSITRGNGERLTQGKVEAVQLPGAVGVVVGGGGAGEGGLEGGVVGQVQIHVVVEVEDAATHVQRAVDVGLGREATLEVP